MLPIIKPTSDADSERLVLAARTGAVEQLLELLDGGADPNIHGKCGSIAGSTALIEAAREHHWHAMSVLLEHGADPNLAAIRPPDSVMMSLSTGLNTPLHAAVEMARGAAMPACVTLLLHYGADPIAKAMLKVTWMSVGAFYKGGKSVSAHEYLSSGGAPGPLQADAKDSARAPTLKLLKQWQDPATRQPLLCEAHQTQAAAAWWQLVRCSVLCASGRASAVGRGGRLLAAIGRLPTYLQAVVICEAWGLEMVAWPEAVPRRAPGEPVYHELLRPSSALLMRPTPARSVVDESLRKILGRPQYCGHEMKGKSLLPALCTGVA